MKPLAVVEFQQHLREATHEAFLGARERCEGPLYGFSLMLDRFGSVVCGIAQSEVGLVRAVAEEAVNWTTDAGDLEKLVSQMKRWTCESWCNFAPAFQNVNHLLEKCYSSGPEEYLHGGTTRLIFLSCLATLAELDVKCVFGKGNQRESLVLNLNVGDQSDEELCRWAVQVNPYEVYARYASELCEAHVAFNSLRYIGPK